MMDEGQAGVTFDSGGFRLLGTLYSPLVLEPKLTAILLHGVPGIEKNVDLAHMRRENGWNWLLIHYRGCWGSAGTYTLKTVPEDASAALNFLEQCGRPQINASKLVLIGHSLGGWAGILAVAVATAVFIGMVG